MQVIVAVDTEWGIGKNNGMLFHMPEDLKFFKEKTSGKIIVMGGNTLLSFPNSLPLPNRTNIVLSDAFTREDCTVLPTLDKLKALLKTLPSEEIFVVGGAMFYSTMLEFCDTAYITKVAANGSATHFFPNLDKMSNWQITATSEQLTSNGYSIKFVTYKNKSPKTF